MTPNERVTKRIRMSCRILRDQDAPSIAYEEGRVKKRAPDPIRINIFKKTGIPGLMILLIAIPNILAMQLSKIKDMALGLLLAYVPYSYFPGIFPMVIL